jgi:hypothetical protein
VPLRDRWVKREIRKNTIKITNSSFVMPAAAIATPAKPRTQAINANTRKIRVQA